MNERTPTAWRSIVYDTPFTRCTQASVNLVVEMYKTDIEVILFEYCAGRKGGGDIGLFITLILKVCNNVFLFVVSTNLGIFY